MCVSLNHSWGLVSQTGIQVKTVDQKHLVVVMTTHSKIIPKQQRQNKSRLWQKEHHHTSHMKNKEKAPSNHVSNGLVLREHLNRNPMGFYHQIVWGFRFQFSHHPILWKWRPIPSTSRQPSKFHWLPGDRGPWFFLLSKKIPSFHGLYWLLIYHWLKID